MVMKECVPRSDDAKIRTLYFRAGPDARLEWLISLLMTTKDEFNGRTKEREGGKAAKDGLDERAVMYSVRQDVPSSSR